MKSKITKIALQNLASGDTSTIIVEEFKGKPGPKVYIQANIHGPEVAGIPVVKKLSEKLKKLDTISGSITLVFSANPIGLNTKIGGFPVGYINHSGDSSKNWNRIFHNFAENEKDLEQFVKDNAKKNFHDLQLSFKKYLKDQYKKTYKEKSTYGLSIENKLSLVLQKLSLDADLVVDLHSAGQNQPHAYTFPNLIQVSKYFGIQHILELPTNEFTGAFDEAAYIPWVKIKILFEKILGKEIALENEAFTLELENDNQVSSLKTDQYVKMLWNYLQYKKVLAGKAHVSGVSFFSCNISDYVKYSAPIGGLVEPLVSVGQKIKKGEALVLIHSITSEKVHAVIAVEDCVVNSFPVSKVVFEGEPVIGILKNLRKV